jgi:hypothetical protein
MKSKWPCILVMGSLSLVLASLLDVLVMRQSLAGLPSLWVSWLASLVLTALIAWRAPSPRSSWALFSAVNGVLSFAVALAYAVRPAAAGARYEPGSDWLSTVDFTPPIAARLREALASGYFAIGVALAGIIFIAAAYLLHQHWDGPQRHAH